MNRSAVLYNEMMKEYLALYKYRGKESLAIPFGQLIKVTYDQYFKETPLDLITYVPLHPSRLQERSFNQAEQLATQLSYYTGIPTIGTLKRIKETHKQSKSGKWERLSEMKDAFQVDEKTKEYIQGKSILIIDDIYTTGATLNECAQELIDSGAGKVFRLTLARA
ncbi:ComF family protein [Tepidibacillus marianensis]|uniref:ComF family protein n=1 Tax=Tepidibacillus marianensis TaxID=3131995 RepID=UPI0030CFBD3B